MSDSSSYNTKRIQAQITGLRSQADFLTANLAIRECGEERKILAMISEIVTDFSRKTERQSSGEEEIAQMSKFAKAPAPALDPSRQTQQPPPNASHLAPSSAMSTLASLAYSALGSM